MKTIMKIIPFIKKTSGSVEKIALVKFTLNKEMRQSQIIHEFKKLVTDWCVRSNTGKKALSEVRVTDDFNIGDFYMNIAEFAKWTNHSGMTRVGIVDIDFIFIGDVEDSEFFDQNLVLDTIFAHEGVNKK